MKKVANRKVGKTRDLENIGKVIPSFRFCPTGKIESSYLKVSEKEIQYFQYF